MKKLIISILIFAILICFLRTSYAILNVTEESLQKAIDKYTANLEESSSDASIKLDKTNKQVLLNSEGESYIINYDLSSKPQFSIDLSFNSSMTKKDCEFETEKTSLLMIMFMLIADGAGIEFEDSMMYMFSSLLENSTSTGNIIFTTPIEYAKSFYDDPNNIPLVDDLFTWTHTKVGETSDEYKVKSTLIINTDKDFSIINGSTDAIVNELSNSIISSVQNTTNQLQNIVENKYTNVNNQSNINKIINSIDKLPQTGNFFDSKDTLIILCISTFIVLILITIKDIKKYRNSIKK